MKGIVRLLVLYMLHFHCSNLKTGLQSNETHSLYPVTFGAYSILQILNFFKKPYIHFITIICIFQIRYLYNVLATITFFTKLH